MADVILFHHAQGVTAGVEAFAQELRTHGHRVTVPDLYDGRVFDDLREGVAHAESIGMEEITAAGVAAADELPGNLVYAGFSLGALPAQKLAQTRPGARAALLYHGGIPTRWFGTPWPREVPLQIHVSEGDEWTELDEVEELARAAPDAEVYVYPGSAHLFTDESLDEYDAGAAALVMQRTLDLLDRVSRGSGLA